MLLPRNFRHEEQRPFLLQDRFLLEFKTKTILAGGASCRRFHEIPKGRDHHWHSQRPHCHRSLCNGMGFHDSRYRSAREDLPTVEAIYHSQRRPVARYRAAGLRGGVDDGGHHPADPRGVVVVVAIFLLFTGSWTFALHNVFIRRFRRFGDSLELLDRNGVWSYQAVARARSISDVSSANECRATPSTAW